MKKLLVVLLRILLVFGIITVPYLKDVRGSKKEAETIMVEIPQGSSVSRIGEFLEENGIIKNSLYFKIYYKLNPDYRFQFGTFPLNKNMSYEEICNILSTVTSKRETVTVTFPEGFTLMQYAKRMENNGLCTAQEFIDVVNNSDFSQFEFWNRITVNDHAFMKCEGYLYPDTYNFYADDSVYNMVETIFKNFDSKITSDIYERMDELGLSLEDTITLASFVQEEAGNPEDMPYVAACLSNRVWKENSPYPGLQCNVCSYINEDGNYVYDYIVDYYGGKNNVPAGMLERYDTYAIIGLPPTAISNPGIDAIKSVLWPAEDFDDYYFFVTDLTGHYYYAKTFEEHLVNVDTAFSVNQKLNK